MICSTGETRGYCGSSTTRRPGGALVLLRLRGGLHLYTCISLHPRAHEHEHHRVQQAEQPGPVRGEGEGGWDEQQELSGGDGRPASRPALRQPGHEGQRGQTPQSRVGQSDPLTLLWDMLETWLFRLSLSQRDDLLVVIQPLCNGPNVCVIARLRIKEIKRQGIGNIKNCWWISSGT